jgi:hypothetical protein
MNINVWRVEAKRAGEKEKKEEKKKRDMRFLSFSLPPFLHCIHRE